MRFRYHSGKQTFAMIQAKMEWIRSTLHAFSEILHLHKSNDPVLPCRRITKMAKPLKILAVCKDLARSG
ncbi:MAG: hypothetical protein M2R45_00050 [Verrucomicrobia subdivision 3 bacterium]|nr:hypothetical protein [Limisphaerales bacterium]MCS1412491.1 hypothetical protein [Limisphaerales bacterium]